jgi:hypothetical protein
MKDPALKKRRLKRSSYLVLVEIFKAVLSIGRFLPRHSGVGNQACTHIEREFIMSSSITRKAGLVTASVVGVIAIVGVAALALPRTVHIERSNVVAAAPGAVFAALASPKSFHQFNPFKDVNPDLQGVISGPAAGIGAQYSWSSSGGKGSQTIVSMKQDAEIKMQLELGSRGRPTQTFSITAVEGGSKVTWAQDGDLGYNPVARVIGTTLDGKLGPIYENGLKKLGHLLAAQTASN